MNYSQLNLFDTMNGNGIRVSLFVSGCVLNCPGCFNKEAQKYSYGEPFGEEQIQKIKAELRKPEVDGLSLLGGDPLAPKNRDIILDLCYNIKKEFPDKTIWLWSGYTRDEISEFLPEILEIIDVLVDGRFEEKLKSDKLEYRGSSNQRIIFLRKE